MKTATIHIQKSLTIVVGNYVYITKLSNLINESNKYNEITIQGISKIEKFDKYLSLLKSNEYRIVSENWKFEFSSGVIDYSITLKK